MSLDWKSLCTLIQNATAIVLTGIKKKNKNENTLRQSLHHSTAYLRVLKFEWLPLKHWCTWLLASQLTFISIHCFSSISPSNTSRARYLRVYFWPPKDHLMISLNVFTEWIKSITDCIFCHVIQKYTVIKIYNIVMFRWPSALFRPTITLFWMPVSILVAI